MKLLFVEKDPKRNAARENDEQLQFQRIWKTFGRKQTISIKQIDWEWIPNYQLLPHHVLSWKRKIEKTKKRRQQDKSTECSTPKFMCVCACMCATHFCSSQSPRQTYSSIGGKIGWLWTLVAARLSNRTLNRVTHHKTWRATLNVPSRVVCSLVRLFRRNNSTKICSLPCT